MIVEYQAEVLAFLGATPIAAAKIHADAEFPKESCGFIANGKYVACKNRADEPEKFFKIEDDRYDAAIKAGTLTAVVHSHPNGPLVPSELDMAQQIVSDVPWVIITVNETGCDKIVAWGDALPVPQVIGRPFVHGILDCYTTLRDVFRLGSDELLKQGVHWPSAPILIPQVPRGDGWWTQGDNLYQTRFESYGFKPIKHCEARPGDCFLIAIGDRVINPKKQLNHTGVLLEHDQILHHMPTDLSRRIPAGPWARAADLWLRYEGPTL